MVIELSGIGGGGGQGYLRDHGDFSADREYRRDKAVAFAASACYVADSWSSRWRGQAGQELARYAPRPLEDDVRRDVG